MTRCLRGPFAIGLVVWIGWMNVPAEMAANGGQAAPQAKVDFDRQVRPIIEEHCLECHSQDKRKGGLCLLKAR